jgi:hypothetical protein
MAAGGDAALGLIPGLKAGRKALSKVDDIADAAGDVGQAAKALEPAMKRQKQLEHVAGSKENARRVAAGQNPSTFHGDEATAIQRSREAYRRGQQVPNRPNVREYDFGREIGTSNGNSATRVRVHQDGAGRIHGHPIGG